MNPDDITRLIDKERQAIAAFDAEIQTARGRDQEDLVEGIEQQKQPHISELDRLQGQVLPQAQKEQADQKAKEAAEEAKKEQKKKDGLSGLLG